MEKLKKKKIENINIGKKKKKNAGKKYYASRRIKENYDTHKLRKYMKNIDDEYVHNIPIITVALTRTYQWRPTSRNNDNGNPQ